MGFIASLGNLAVLSLEELSTVSRRIAGDSKLSILRSANIKLSSLGESIVIPKVLPDTGASHHSYIDENFLEANISILGSSVQTVGGERSSR